MTEQLLTRVPINALCSGIPGDNLSVSVQQEKRVVVLRPRWIFIGPGRHVLKDLPQLAANAMERNPGLEIELAAPIGEAEEVVDAMARYALAAGL